MQPPAPGPGRSDPTGCRTSDDAEGLMIDLDPQLVAWAAVGAVAVSVLLAILLAIVALRLRGLRRDVHRAVDPARGEDVLSVLAAHRDRLHGLQTDVDHLQAETADLRSALTTTVSQVGIVRYDAFDDMGGALSFSAALMDEHGDGLVISAINGRSETRCYAKPISNGQSAYNLSREETAAIDAARTGIKQAPGVAPAGRRRRRGA
jgi:hypothetical protein